MSKQEKGKPTSERNNNLSDFNGKLSSHLSKEVQKLVNQNVSFNNPGILRQFEAFRSLQQDINTISYNTKMHRIAQITKTLDSINISNQRLIDSYKEIFQSQTSLNSISSVLNQFAKVDEKQIALRQIGINYKSVFGEFSSSLNNLEKAKRRISKSLGLEFNSNLFNVRSTFRELENLFHTYNDNLNELSVDEFESVARNAIDKTRGVIEHKNNIEGQDSKEILDSINITYAYNLIMLIFTAIMIYQSHSSTEKLVERLDGISRDLKDVAESAKNKSVEMNVNIDIAIEKNSLIAKRESTIREEPTSKSDSVGIILKDQVMGLIQSKKRWNNVFYIDSETGGYEVGWIYKGNLKK